MVLIQIFSSIGVIKNLRPNRYRNAFVSDCPDQYENAIWLVDARNHPKCSRCPPAQRCETCKQTLAAEGNLIKRSSV